MASQAPTAVLILGELPFGLDCAGNHRISSYPGHNLQLHRHAPVSDQPRAGSDCGTPGLRRRDGRIGPILPILWYQAGERLDGVCAEC